jgi:hypothetical protein
MIVCTYRSPAGAHDQFLNKCDLTLKYLHNLNMAFVIWGDFNINFLNNSIFKQQITLLFQTYNLFQSINF